MEIHELNTFGGSLGASSYFAIDNGTDTGKISFDDLAAPLNERINNIIAGPASSAEEVIDARLGADGYTYASLGDAIRGQVTDLGDRILKYTSENLVELDTAWTRGAINADGTINTAAQWRLTSTSILSNPNTDVVFKLDSGFTGQIATFTAGGTFIARRTLTDGYVLDAGSYYRVSVYKAAEQVSDNPLLFFHNIHLLYRPYEILNPTTYSNKLSNITKNLAGVALNNEWDDAPWTHLNISSTGIFINTRYSENYCLQEFTHITSGNKWSRITNIDGTIYRDWTMVNGVLPLKILALGDSICAGYRNGGKGFVGDLGLPYKNIGVSNASISNIVTSVTNIPDQLIAETSYQPDIIIAEGGINDYVQGADLGIAPNAPAKNDTDANALNRDTIAGATGFLFYQMIKLHPKAQRFFVIVHKMYYEPYDYYYPTFNNVKGYTQQDLHDLLVEMCKLYNVKIIDVYEDGIINTLYSAYRSPVDYDTDPSVTYTQYVNSDGIHPLDLGYREGYAPLIRQAIGIGTKK